MQHDSANHRMNKENHPFSVVHFPSCESTHLWALQNLQTLITQYGLSQTQPLRISTDLQTKGVGQQRAKQCDSQSSQNKSWISSDGNIFVTFVYQFTGGKAIQISHFPQIAALVVADVLREFGLEPKVKWVRVRLLCFN